MTAGMGADVVIFDTSLERLSDLVIRFATTPVRSRALSRLVLEDELRRADAVIGAVLIRGARAPRLLKRDDLCLLRAGAVLVDVSIDQGGCFESSRPTTHADPIFVVDDVIHYCVANLPGLVPRASTRAVTAATLPYIKSLAALGTTQAVETDAALASGVSIRGGDILDPGVGAAAAEAGR